MQSTDVLESLGMTNQQAHDARNMLLHLTGQHWSFTFEDVLGDFCEYALRRNVTHWDGRALAGIVKIIRLRRTQQDVTLPIPVDTQEERW